MKTMGAAFNTVRNKVRRDGITGLLRAISYRLPYAAPAAKTVARRLFGRKTPRKTLWIHIGMHKTGTTFLQRVLVEERHSLQAFSIWFDEASIDFGEFLCQSSPLPPAELDRQRRLLHERYDRRPEDVIILSSEFFFGDPDAAYQNIGAVARDLKALVAGYDVRIVACLRRQDEFIQSWYHQYVKRGGMESFEQYGRNVGLHRFQWDKLLAAYEEQFGRENLRVLVYEQVAKARGSWINTFFDGLGAQFHIRPRDFRQFNPSFSEKGLKLALLCYPHLDLQERKRLRDHLLDAFPKKRGENFSLLSEAERKALMASYRESNRRCFEKYCDPAENAEQLGYA